MYDLGPSEGDAAFAVPTVLDALVDPNGVAFWMSQASPSATAVALADAMSPSNLSDRGCLDLLTVLEAQINWLTARQQTVLAEIAKRHEAIEVAADGPPWHGVQEEVGCALRLAGRTSAARIDTAVALCTRLPATLALLEAGNIGYRQAVSLANAVTDLDQETVTAVESRVLGRATSQTVGEFNQSVKRAVIALDPVSAEDKQAMAADGRRVCLRPADDGMSELWALLPTPAAAVVMEAIQTVAGAAPAEDVRNMDQRRADALVQLAAGVLHDPSAPRAQGLRPHIQVTVAATTLLDLDETPAELDGYGPIPAETARQLAADPTGTWRRILTDPVSGTLLDYGRTTYRPSPSLAAHVMARDRECVFVGCHRRAYRCDIDHLRRWTDGGTTDSDCLDLLCRRHHILKDQHGWTVHADRVTGCYHWTSPKGRRYVKFVPTYSEPAKGESLAGGTAKGESASERAMNAQQTTSKTVDSHTTDSQTVDSQTVDSESTDSESTDSETLNGESVNGEAVEIATADSDPEDGPPF